MEEELNVSSSASPYQLLLNAALLIPVSHYFLGFLFVFLVFLYDLFEIHFLRDLFTVFRGQSVSLIYDSSSHVYQEVVSRCKILHSRYLSTPWLSSPHLQTAFVSYFGRPPVFSYKRELYKLTDGGTIALDWLMHTDVMKPAVRENDAVDSKVPIMIVIPGLTSNSDSQYVRHLTFNMAKRGWNVVVSNHRGLGGVSLTSDCFYNAGWTDDIRKVVNHLHCLYPEAPLFIVGTSIGANILVKYLGEDGINVPVIGAAAICCPWDLLICDRFISRRPVQRLYDRFLASGLVGYAHLHQTILSRLADWEGIAKSRSVRHFDHYCTRVVGNFETVDTYYRHCCSAHYVRNVMVPLLCINALDDPVCTWEAIPWDECRANKNVVLASTQHGGHLAFFEGMSAKSIWWVRAVGEYLSLLQSSPLIHRRKEDQVSSITNPLESSIDEGPYVNIAEDGRASAIRNGPETDVAPVSNENVDQNEKSEDTVSDTKNDDDKVEQIGNNALTGDRDGAGDGIKKCLNQLTRFNGCKLWLLAYLAIGSSWPLLRLVYRLMLKNKFRSVYSGTRKRI